MTTSEKISTSKRSFPLDVLRVLACFLVIWQHAVEPYYIQADLTLARHDEMPLLGWMNSLTPIEVPLFVMLSGYFLLPIKPDSAFGFLKHRMSRILCPFITWCVLYALYYKFTRGDGWTDFLRNLLHIPVNFGVEVGHLWFIYMLIGLYLMAPIVSPWLRTCSRNELRGYLWLWGCSTCLPFVHLVFPQVWGECFWNPTPLLYYFTGFGGYFILGHYIRRYGGLPWKKALVLLLVTYLLTVGFYQWNLPRAVSVSDFELGWRFCGFNMAIMAYAFFSIAIQLPWRGQSGWGKVVSYLSQVSYGIYFIHLMVLAVFHQLLGDCMIPLWLKIPMIAGSTFLVSSLVIWLLSYLPKSRLYLGS